MTNQVLPSNTAALLREISGGEHRTAAHIERDLARKPVEMYEFFGIEPWMTVVDIWPTTAWSTEILAPLLQKEGKLYAAHFLKDHKDDTCRRQRKIFEEKLATEPEIYGEVVVSDLGKGVYQCAPEGSADMVITLRNFHNWMQGGYLDPVLEHFFAILKTGGIFALEEHRARQGEPQDPTARSSIYMQQDYVIAAIESAGFILEARSEIGANPKDTKDHPFGALSLAPNCWGVEDKDRARIKAIGESDRMTLRFRKPGINE